MEEIFKTIGIIIVIIFIGYVLLKTMKLQFSFMNSVKEGLTNSSTSSTITSDDGYAGNAASFSANIKALTTILTDKLIVSKYRTDYENIILNLEEYINLLMLNTVLTIDTSSNNAEIVNSLNNLGTLNASKLSLNSVMTYLDSMSS